MCISTQEPSLVAQMVKNPPAMQEMQVWPLSQEDPLEKEMATHFSTLAWEIPWTEEPGGLPFTGSHRIGHDWTIRQQQKNMFIHCDYLGE